jgi:hypothetical protein
LDVRTTSGGSFALISPTSGIETACSVRTSRRKASNSSSARSTSSISRTLGLVCSARRTGRASRKRGS